MSPVELQTLLEGLGAAHTAMLGAAPQTDAHLVLLRQQGREQEGETRRQLTEVLSALQHQLA